MLSRSKGEGQRVDSVGNGNGNGNGSGSSNGGSVTSVSFPSLPPAPKKFRDSSNEDAVSGGVQSWVSQKKRARKSGLREPPTNSCRSPFSIPPPSFSTSPHQMRAASLFTPLLAGSSASPFLSGPEVSFTRSPVLATGDEQMSPLLLSPPALSAAEFGLLSDRLQRSQKILDQMDARISRKIDQHFIEVCQRINYLRMKVSLDLREEFERCWNLKFADRFLHQKETVERISREVALLKSQLDSSHEKPTSHSLPPSNEVVARDSSHSSASEQVDSLLSSLLAVKQQLEIPPTSVLVEGFIKSSIADALEEVELSATELYEHCTNDLMSTIQRATQEILKTKLQISQSSLAL